MKHITIYLLLTLVCCGCNSLAPKEYVSYITGKGSGMNKQSIIRDYHYKIQFLPVEYKVLLEEGPDKNIDMEKSKQLFEEGLYFNLRVIDSTALANPGMIKQKSINFDGDTYNHINFWFEPNVFLVVNQDTIKCRLSHLEPLGSNNPVFNFSMVFDMSERYLEEHRNDSLYFIFDDNIWSKKKIITGFHINQLVNRPSLKI